MTSKQKLMLSFEIALLLLYTFTIFSLSSGSVAARYFFFEHIDKLYHLVTYLVMGAIICQIGFRLSRSFFWSVWLGGLVASLYGISDEWHQFFVPSRSSSLGDIVADMCGAWLGSFLWAVWIGPLYRKIVP